MVLGTALGSKTALVKSKSVMEGMRWCKFSISSNVRENPSIPSFKDVKTGILFKSDMGFGVFLDRGKQFKSSFSSWPQRSN
jgi:hypothetical protein